MHFLVSLSNASYSYPLDEKKTYAIRDVSLDISRGETLVISGAMGTGKTTLVYLMLGLLAPTKGTVKWHTYGEKKTKKATPDINTIGYIPQTPEDSFVKDTVYDDILFGLDIPTEKWDARVKQALDVVGLQHNVLHRAPQTLSTGEALLCRLASAVIKNPTVLILDDPLQGLDAKHRTHVLDIMKTFSDDPTKTLIVATSTLCAFPYATVYRLG